MKSKDVAKKLQYRAPARVMTVRDVSAYLRVHPSTIYKLQSQSTYVIRIRNPTDGPSPIQTAARSRF
jgi:hypothetical protein